MILVIGCSRRLPGRGTLGAESVVPSAGRLVSNTKGLIVAALAIAAVLSGTVVALVLLTSSVGFDDWPAPPAGHEAQPEPSADGLGSDGPRLVTPESLAVFAAGGSAEAPGPLGARLAPGAAFAAGSARGARRTRAVRA